MSWPEVELAINENRHELVLSGPQINERLEENGFDSGIFEITGLNYLNIHESNLSEVAAEISKLVNLQTLVLHSNKLTEITPKVAELDKLKVLDLSRNSIDALPKEFSNLKSLTTLNLSFNKLESLPTLTRSTKLFTLDVSNNKLSEFPDICTVNVGLFELKLSNNEIDSIPSNINLLVTLKSFDISHNKIKAIPGELSGCTKLKDLNLKENPVTDRRLLKLIDQCRPKQVLDYVKQHCPYSSKPTGSQQKSKKGKGESSEENRNDDREYLFKIIVKSYHVPDDKFSIIVKDDVKTVRGHIVACLVHNVEFDELLFKKFIQLQSKLHDGICDKRNSATIATHDAKKLGDGQLVYTAVAPDELKIRPLNRKSVMSGAELYGRLQVEAEALRKEKKRNVYSGIHKYLYLLEGQSKYPCLLNAAGDVISFPPITNSDVSKISVETTSIFVEVTSSTGMGIAKKVADALLKEMVVLFNKDLMVQQVKNVDVDGNLKSVYPSRADLVYDDNASIKIIRD